MFLLQPAQKNLFKKILMVILGFIMTVSADIYGDNENVELMGRWGYGSCLAVDAVGDTAYLGNGAYLEIVDFSDPADPVNISKLLLAGPIQDISVSGSYVFVASYNEGLRIVDITDPESPLEVGFIDTQDRAMGVTVSGDYAYVADAYNGLRIINVTDPAHPVETGYLNTDGYSRDVAVSNSTDYQADGT